MSKVSLLAEFWEFIKYRKKLWLLPIVIAVLVLGALIAMTPTVVTPFNYPYMSRTAPIRAKTLFQP